MGLTINLSSIPAKVMAQVEAELPSRAVRAANELLNAEHEIMRGQGGGRRYGNHQASAPGEVPAVWSGHYRDSYKTLEDNAHLPGIESETKYAHWLEEGTPGGQMAPRPHVEKILQMAEPQIIAIYSEPWHISV